MQYIYLYIYIFSDRERGGGERRRRQREFLIETAAADAIEYGEQKRNERWPRGYPALSTRVFVVNNVSPWRRTRRSESWQTVRGLVGPSPSLSRSFFSSLSLFFLTPFSVVLSLSLWNLSHINWFDPDVSLRETPIGHRSHAVCFVRFVASPPPICPLHPTGPRSPFFSFSRGLKYSRKLRGWTVRRARKSSLRGSSKGQKRASLAPLTSHSPNVILWDPLPRYRGFPNSTISTNRIVSMPIPTWYSNSHILLFTIIQISSKIIR